jgi:peptidoglycan/LPS O-acetylase OafA/YrhL
MTEKFAGTHERIEGLDLLRGLAIGLVLVRHAWPELVGGGGIVGVVVFFALSGYLITGILVSDIQSFGRVRYGRFYRNRIVRLIPALLVMLSGFTLVALTKDPLGERPEIASAWIVGLTYTADLPFVHGSESLGHLWTLAIEEQFYLIWPIVLVIGLKHGTLRRLLVYSAIAMLGACIVSTGMTSPRISEIYKLPTSWAITLLIGAAAFLERERVAYWLPRTGWERAALSSGALALLLGISIIPEAKNSPAAYLILGPLVAVLTVALIYHMRTWRKLPTIWLQPVLALGKISYAAYLWNYPLAKWLAQYPWYTGRSWLSIVLTIAAATGSWWLVEKPISAWNRRRSAAPGNGAGLAVRSER